MFERQEMLNVISNVLDFLTKAEKKNRSVEKQIPNNTIAKKDLAKKLENKSVIDWER